MSQTPERLRAALAAVLGAERFVVEIRTTAALQHPHILPLFDSGEADGFLYYVMPFVDGETLRAKLDRETQLGVIHRDIKPENILLANGRPMVADFGIALAVSAAAGGRMTETGLSLGTPHYMSPEQATAEKEISARSDVYSLASVLYEMLAGQPPHLITRGQVCGCCLPCSRDRKFNQGPLSTWRDRHPRERRRTARGVPSMATDHARSCDAVTAAPTPRTIAVP